MPVPWDQLVMWLIGLAAALYLARQAVHKRKNPGCGGCGTSCSTSAEKTAVPVTPRLVQIEMSRPQRHPGAPPRPSDPSLN